MFNFLETSLMAREFPMANLRQDRALMRCMRLHAVDSFFFERLVNYGHSYCTTLNTKASIVETIWRRKLPYRCRLHANTSFFRPKRPKLAYALADSEAHQHLPFCQRRQRAMRRYLAVRLRCTIRNREPEYSEFSLIASLRT